MDAQRERLNALLTRLKLTAVRERLDSLLDAAARRELTLREALPLLGPPGVGKTHLAVGLGREAIARGCSVLFSSAAALMTALVKGHSEGRLEERLVHLRLVRSS